MKEYNATWFEAHAASMAFALPDKFPTVEAAHEAANESRIREVERGYKPTDYIIIKITAKTIYDDNGLFVSDTTHRERVG